MPLTTTFAGAGIRGLAWGSSVAAAAESAVELIKPSTVDVSGPGSPTATINTNGSVDFSACANFTLNNVFSSTYDNYVILLRAQITSAGSIEWIMASGGGGASTTNGYNSQALSIFGTGETAALTTQNSGFLGGFGNTTLRGALTAYVYGPFLAQPTAIKTVTHNPSNNASIQDFASTHNVSTSYDGIRIMANVGTITGTVSVYGLVN